MQSFLILIFNAESPGKWRRAGNQKKICGAKRDRTADLLNAIQTLSHLSYSPKIEL